MTTTTPSPATMPKRRSLPAPADPGPRPRLTRKGNPDNSATYVGRVRGQIDGHRSRAGRILANPRAVALDLYARADDLEAKIDRYCLAFGLDRDGMPKGDR